MQCVNCWWSLIPHEEIKLNIIANKHGGETGEMFVAVLLIYVCHNCQFSELQSVCEMRWGRKETNVFDQAEIFVAATGTVDALNTNSGPTFNKQQLKICSAGIVHCQGNIISRSRMMSVACCENQTPDSKLIM